MDFEIKYELDLSVNNRIIIIERNGEIRYLTSNLKYPINKFNHIDYFRNYFDEKLFEYTDLKDNIMLIKNMYGVFYYLAKLEGLIIFADLSAQDEINERRGIIQFPDLISEEQRESYLNLMDIYIRDNFEELAVFFKGFENISNLQTEFVRKEKFDYIRKLVFGENIRLR